MNLGDCRHCGRPGIASDAPICGACTGWHPNPGLLTRLGLVVGRVLGLLFLLAGLAACLYIRATQPADQPGSYFLPGFVVFCSARFLFLSFVYPYGRQPDLH